jgi:hypothetical protein
MFSLVFITFILFVFGLSFFFVEMIQTFSSYMNHKSEKHIEPKEGINIDISEEITDETDYSDYYNESEHKPLTNKTRVSDLLQIEHGNRYFYDIHGNVIYGLRYVGAPILPFRRFGYTTEQFLEKYFQLSEAFRTEFTKFCKDNCTEQIHNRIINYLYEYEFNHNSKEILTKDLKSLVKSILIRGSNGNQLKYFKDFDLIFTLFERKQDENNVEELMCVANNLEKNKLRQREMQKENDV